MSGDPPGRGDHPDAVGVFDLKAETLLDAVRAMNSGADMYGKELNGTPSIFAGAVANPGADDMDHELARMEEKVRRGAAFFQTQAVYDAAAFETFMETARGFGVPVLAGMIVLKSARMGRFLNDKLPGVSVPESIIDEMDAATGQSRRRRPNHRSPHPGGARHVRRHAHYGHRLGVAHSRHSDGGGPGLIHVGDMYTIEDKRVIRAHGQVPGKGGI